jgi:hypothetical protein
MASRSPQTQLKRARELAVKERRERKQAKKAARATERREQSEQSHTDVLPDPDAGDEETPA